MEAFAGALTEPQQRVLGFVRAYAQEHGYPPTRAEIARGMGFASANAAEEHLKALERRGAVQIKRGVARGIRVV